MRIAVINETSSADRNSDILGALEGRGHEIINAGMTKNGEKPELNYIHTGLMTAILLNLERVDFVVGGCGTGQGYLESAMQYPGVFCGYILSPLDAWLFTKINDGNCISLALNQGYGWAADIKLKFIFDQIFGTERGSGYPSDRSKPERDHRMILKDLSLLTHKSFAKIIEDLPEKLVKPVFEFPNMKKLIDVDTISDNNLKLALHKRLKR